MVPGRQRLVRCRPHHRRGPTKARRPVRSAGLGHRDRPAFGVHPHEDLGSNPRQLHQQPDRRHALGAPRGQGRQPERGDDEADRERDGQGADQSRQSDGRHPQRRRPNLRAIGLRLLVHRRSPPLQEPCPHLRRAGTEPPGVRSGDGPQAQARLPARSQTARSLSGRRSRRCVRRAGRLFRDRNSGRELPRRALRHADLPPP